MMTTASTTTSPQATTISEKKKKEKRDSLNERQTRLRGRESGNEIEAERQIGRER